MKSCVGVMARTVSWLQDLPQTKPLQLHQAVLLARIAMRFTSMLEIITLALYLTTVAPLVGARIQTAN